jgi:hypothetical protein
MTRILKGRFTTTALPPPPKPTASCLPARRIPTHGRCPSAQVLDRRMEARWSGSITPMLTNSEM